MFAKEELLVDVPVNGSQGLLSYRTSSKHKLAFYKVPLLAFLKPLQQSHYLSGAAQRSKRGQRKTLDANEGC